MIKKLLIPAIMTSIALLIFLTGLLSRNIHVQAADINNTDCQISESYPQSIQQWCGLIQQHAEINQLDPNLLAALILQESGGQPEVMSVNGAVGLMQVMPRDGIAAGFQCPNGPCFAARPSIQELLDPAFNIEFGSAMLAALINKYGSVREGLFAYGPTGVGYAYADAVLTIYQQY